MNKRGLSNVVATVIMIAIVIAATVLVWVVINNTVNKEVEGTTSCFGIFDKVSLEPEYTCYDSSGKYLLFGIGIGDLEVDGIIVSVSSVGGSTSLTIDKKSSSDNSNLKFYNGTLNEWAPGINTGFTYNLTGINSLPDSIRIAPIIGGKQCAETDEITEIESCSSLL